MSEGEGGEAAEDGGGRGLKVLCVYCLRVKLRVPHHVKASSCS